MPDETVAKLGELEETTRTPLYYVDEDYPVGPEIPTTCPWMKQLTWLRSSTLETDVYVWLYALLVVNATEEEDEELTEQALLFTIQDHLSVRQTTVL